MKTQPERNLPMTRPLFPATRLLACAFAFSAGSVVAIAQHNPDQPAQPAKPAAQPGQPANPVQQPGQPQPNRAGQPLLVQPPPPPGTALAVDDKRPDFKGPGIAFDTPAYNFGKMMGGADVRHDFWFTNIGTEKLEVSAVRPSCGCTTAGDWDRVVDPGKSGRIPIRMTTGKISGHIAKTITVTTNAKEQSNVILRVEGDLWQPVQITPQFIAMGRLQGDTLTKPTTREAIIESNVTEPLEIKSVDTQSALFKAEVQPMVPGKKYKLIVTSVPPFQPGSVVANIKVLTNSTAVPEIVIPASAFIPPPIQVIPPQLHLPANMAAAYERKIYIQNNANEAFTLSNLRCPDTKLDVSVTPKPGPMGYEVLVKVPPNYTVPGTGVMISLDTTVAAAKTIQIPVTQGAVGSMPPPVPPMTAGQAQPLKPAADPHAGHNHPPGQGH